jgi:hypothetical protein
MNISETVVERQLVDIHLGSSSGGDGVPFLHSSLSNQLLLKIG